MDIDGIPIEEAVRGGNLALRAISEGRLGRTEGEVKQLQAAFLMYRKLSVFMANGKAMFVIGRVLPCIAIPLSFLYFHKGVDNYGLLVRTGYDAVSDHLFFGTMLVFLAFSKFFLSLLKNRCAKLSREYLKIIREVPDNKAA